MFRKKMDDSDTKETPALGSDMAEDIDAPPLEPFSKKCSHTPPRPPGPASTPFRTEIPRRSADLPGSLRRVERGRAGETESKKLIVGREISFSGQITSCDKLVVEGTVEASLRDARMIEVAPEGFFKGDAQVEEADISGRFEGELTAYDRVVVRAGGRVSGCVRYGRIVIESGGEVSGEMEALHSAGEIAAEGRPGIADESRHEPETQAEEPAETE
jgi:cytoskeletal protein CcmA (bactofilin family)